MLSQRLFVIICAAKGRRWRCLPKVLHPKPAVSSVSLVHRRCGARGVESSSFTTPFAADLGGGGILSVPGSKKEINVISKHLLFLSFSTEVMSSI